MSDRAFTVQDAENKGHVLDVHEHDGNLIGDCVRNGERCWSFAITTNRDALERDYIEHAARERGVCWACSQPEQDWPNRTKCRRCWTMSQPGWPRDHAPFPGDHPDCGEETS